MRGRTPDERYEPVIEDAPDLPGSGPNVEEVVSQLPPDCQAVVIPLVRELADKIATLTKAAYGENTAFSWLHGNSVALLSAHISHLELRIKAGRAQAAANDERLSRLAVAIYDTTGSEAQQLDRLRQTAIEALGVLQAVTVTSNCLEEAAIKAEEASTPFSEAVASLSKLLNTREA